MLCMHSCSFEVLRLVVQSPPPSGGCHDIGGGDYKVQAFFFGCEILFSSTFLILSLKTKISAGKKISALKKKDSG